MTNTRIKTLLGVATIVASFVGGAAYAKADSLEDIMQVGIDRTKAALTSQGKIDRLADEPRDLLADYHTLMKPVEGLPVYNARLDRQIANQERRIGDIDQSISDAAIIQRQIPPLVTRMLDGLDQFIDLDMPFDLERRKGNMAAVRANLDRADVTAAEAFRQVLELYSIELQYGRGMETYPATILVDGFEREVQMLRIGRVALVAQTTDGVETRAWNNDVRTWEALPSAEYSAAVRKAVRIADKRATIELLNMPIAAPEAN